MEKKLKIWITQFFQASRKTKKSGPKSESGVTKDLTHNSPAPIVIDGHVTLIETRRSCGTSSGKYLVMSQGSPIGFTIPHRELAQSQAVDTTRSQ